MRHFKSITSLLFLAVLSVGLTAQYNSPMISAALFSTLVLASFAHPNVRGAMYMAITREIWTADIIENLFKNNEFAKRAFNADQYVLSGKVVHIPVAGAAAVIKKNLTSFPQVAVKRADLDVTYAIDTFYTVPRHVEQIEKYELSYDKRQSILGEDQAALTQFAMDGLLYNWLPAVAKTKMTLGADRAATVPGASAPVKRFTKESIDQISLEFGLASVPHAGRCALLTATHYNDFINSLTDAERTDVGRVANLAEGLVGRYMGFDIYMRSTVGRYRGNDGAFVKVDEQDDAFAPQANDRAASLFWHEKQVERAQGDVEIFDNPRQAEYYGDVVSMTMRLGGRIRKAEAVWAVVEALA